MTATEFKKQLLPHYRRMYAVAMTMLHNSDDASDMVQEAFTKLWENEMNYKTLTTLKPIASRS